MNRLSLSVASGTQVLHACVSGIQALYTCAADLPGNLELMRRLNHAGVLDGFEFQNLAEWDAATPPWDDSHNNRFAVWEACRKYTIDELAASLIDTGQPILSIHANRDVGMGLCEESARGIARGKQLARESMGLAARVGAGVCVFHLWDTWKETFNPVTLHDALAEIVPRYPGVKAAIENVPTHLNGATPFDLAREFDWITLDLRWAALYDELGKFETVVDRIANVHLRGRLEGVRWVLRDAPFGFYDAIERIKGWGYAGLWTVESEGGLDNNWDNLVVALADLADRVKVD